MHFGQKIRELREGAGLTQVGLAEASGVPIGTIRDYEQMKRAPLLPAVQKLAKALGASLGDFEDVSFGDGTTDAEPHVRPGRGRPPKSTTTEKPAPKKRGQPKKPT